MKWICAAAIVALVCAPATAAAETLRFVCPEGRAGKVYIEGVHMAECPGELDIQPGTFTVEVVFEQGEPFVSNVELRQGKDSVLIVPRASTPEPKEPPTPNTPSEPIRPDEQPVVTTVDLAISDSPLVITLPGGWRGDSADGVTFIVSPDVNPSVTIVNVAPGELEVSRDAFLNTTQQMFSDMQWSPAERMTIAGNPAWMEQGRGTTAEGAVMVIELYFVELSNGGHVLASVAPAESLDTTRRSELSALLNSIRLGPGRSFDTSPTRATSSYGQQRSVDHVGKSSLIMDSWAFSMTFAGVETETIESFSTMPGVRYHYRYLNAGGDAPIGKGDDQLALDIRWGLELGLLGLSASLKSDSVGSLNETLFASLGLQAGLGAAYITQQFALSAVLMGGIDTVFLDWSLQAAMVPYLRPELSVEFPMYDENNKLQMIFLTGYVGPVPNGLSGGFAFGAAFE